MQASTTTAPEFLFIEIVSEPCMHSPKEAVAYAMAVKAIMQYLDASDCNMEDGSLRVDANISVRHKDEKGSAQQDRN